MRKGPDFEPQSKIVIMPPDEVAKLLSVVAEDCRKPFAEFEEMHRQMQKGFDEWCLTLRESI